MPALPPPHISILIPTHNRADVLPYAIRSVLTQTRQDFEMLIVGDGCTDHTAQVVAGFDDPRLHWFDLPKGPGFGYYNRNVALRRARGDLVAYLAHDDLWLPDHLELLSAVFDDPRVEWAYTRPLEVTADGFAVPGVFDLTYPEVMESLLTGRRNDIPLSCVVHRRAAFDRYGYWNDHILRGGDAELWSRIFVGGDQKNFAYVPLPTSLHFVADWRRTLTGPDGRQLPVPYELLAAMRARWPELCFQLRRGQTEQDGAWQTIAADPAGWSAAMRRAVQASAENRVYIYKEAVRYTEELQILRATELQILRESLGVRLTLRLREWRWRVAPAGTLAAKIIAWLSRAIRAALRMS